MPRCLAWLVAACLVSSLGGCGGDEETTAASPTVGHWKHCTVAGLAGAGGLTFYEGDLVAVAGGGDRAVYTVPTADLEHTGSVRARSLRVDVRPEAMLLGSEPFGLAGYKLEHLWALPVDFQGVAVQQPDFVYLGERGRRVVFWGRLARDAAGRLASVRLTGVSVAPGADRTKVDEGDWRDHGPGLAGLLSPARLRRMEDVCVLDRAPHAGPALRIHRMDRLGSSLGVLPVKHDIGDALECNAISWNGLRYVIHYGAGRGRLATVKQPDGKRSGVLGRGAPGPAVEGVERWTGLAHGTDGTTYLISDGDPAVLAWRAP